MGKSNFTKATTLIVVSGVSLNALFLTSCDTPVGQGAAWGAATGAIIGGAATGHVRGASIGAAAGAAAGALTGAAIQENPGCVLWSAAAGRISLRAVGGNAGILL